MISRDTIEKVLDTADIVEIVSQFVTLKKEGASWKGKSPFGFEKTPSFFVVPSKGIYKDFSSGKGGNVVDFLMQKERMTFPEAIRYLADYYKIPVEGGATENAQERTERENIFKALAAWQNRFRSAFIGSPADVMMVDRGFDAEICEQFGIGYCVLGTQHEMSGRITFPIHNASQKIVAFGGRSIDGSQPKYKTSGESLVYFKSKTLYGLHLAKDQMSRTGKAYLVEGYTDVMRMHQHGITNTVASCGTALTKDQVTTIRRYCDDLVIVMDGDAAGIKAAQNGIDLALLSGMNVRLKLLPDGMDPDEYLHKKGRERFDKIEEVNFIDYKIMTFLDLSKNDKSITAACVRGICASISKVQDPALREMYVMDVVRKFNIADVVVRKYLSSDGPVVEDKKQDAPVRAQWETDLARLMFQHGFETIHIDHGGKLEPMYLAEYVVASLEVDGIMPEDTAVAYMMKYYNEHMAQGKQVTGVDIALDDRLRQLYSDMVMSVSVVSPGADELKKAAVDLVHYVKMRWVNKEISAIDDALASDGIEQMEQLITKKQELLDFRMRISGLNGRAVV